MHNLVVVYIYIYIYIYYLPVMGTQRRVSLRLDFWDKCYLLSKERGICSNINSSETKKNIFSNSGDLVLVQVVG
jgi:hypothetical protein